ncbi:GATA zinc finger domain-containing protein 11 [Musca domestica]|uniref:GATA zinc finger domain-containing protein 11 n=1 Tax=Musca domestica TaxID=7370 RepID=A0A1I8NJ97_MUSDO|nr:GATA zinc finger domain-containing protein 11 [Musca domestica]
MELRSSRSRNEYKELQLTLNGMGFYEEGMELQEMRQILDALNQSVTDGETQFLDDDMERAIRESEMDFMPANNGGLWNSTMLRTQVTSSPCSSPDIPSQQIVVHAEVHHPLDWSPQYPEEERLRRKRLASETGSHNEAIQPFIKRINPTGCSPTKPKETNEPNNNNEMVNHLNASNNSSHGHIEIVGPVSMRGPCNDSGVISPHEVSNATPSSSPENNTNSGNESTINGSSSSTNNSHIVLGPISARRPINDSGVMVNNEPENHNASESSWNFNDSSNSVRAYFQSNVSMQLRNVYATDDDDDLEHSEPSM